MKRALWVVGVALALLTSAHGQDAYEAGISLSPDEKTFAVGNGGSMIGLFRVGDGRRVRTFKAHTPNYEGLFTKPVFSPDGKYLTAGNLGPDGGVNPVWEVRTGRVVASLGIWRQKGDPEAMKVVGWSGDGKYVLGSVYFGRHLVAFSRRDWKLAFLEDSYDDDYSTPTAIRPTGTLVIDVPSKHGGFHIWDPIVGYMDSWGVWPIIRPDDISYMTFSGDGHVLFMAGDGWLATVDQRKLPRQGVIHDGDKGIDNDYRPPKTQTLSKFIVRSVCASRKGDFAFLGARDGRIARFEMKTGKCVKTWKAFDGPVKGLTLTRDGRTLLSYDLGTVKIWSAASGRLLRTVKT